MEWSLIEILSIKSSKVIGKKYRCQSTTKDKKVRNLTISKGYFLVVTLYACWCKARVWNCCIHQLRCVIKLVCLKVVNYLAVPRDFRILAIAEQNLESKLSSDLANHSSSNPIVWRSEFFLAKQENSFKIQLCRIEINNKRRNWDSFL